MTENFKLTREQIFLLVFISALGNIIYSHTWIDDNTDRAAWVAALAGISLVIPFAVWILYLGKQRPGETIFDILESGLGKFPCAAVSAIYIVINIAVAVAMLNMFTQMLKSFTNLYTPVWAIMLFLVLVAALLVSGGFKPFARTVELLTVLGLGNYFFSFVFAFPDKVHLAYVLPVFDTSLLGFVTGTAFMTGAASECLLLLIMIVAFIPHPGKHYLWVVTGLVFNAVVFSSAILMIIAILSPEMAKRIAFGGVNAARLIQISDYFIGFELFIFGTYQFIAVGKTAMCLYCAWTAAKKMFNNWKPGVQLLLTALLIFAPSLWLSSYIKAYQLAVFLGSYIILPFSVFVLLLASYCVKVAKKKAGCAAK